jgi:hypothetical protein
MRYVHYKIFRSTIKSWRTLFEKAAAFAETIGPERLIGIAHSDSGLVTVWYWSDRPRTGLE